MDEREGERRRMVEMDLRRKGIRDDRVLAAMERVARHDFVPPEDRARAYGDHPLPIGEGQTISQPWIVAAMTERLELGGGERVLEIGTGSGYQTAVLAELAGEVFTVERHAALSAHARVLLTTLGYGNVRYRVGDGSVGWPEEAPFDRILVTAAAPEIPPAILDQLADPGILALPVGTRRVQNLVTVHRRGGADRSVEHFSCAFVPLVGSGGFPD